MEALFSFLGLCDIQISDIQQLNNIEIARDILLDTERYRQAQEHIIQFRHILSSSYLTSLQSTAAINQRWPLINLLRQILKAYGYRMVPKRRAAGYTKDGIKLYKRVFIIKPCESEKDQLQHDASDINTNDADTSDNIEISA